MQRTSRQFAGSNPDPAGTLLADQLDWFTDGGGYKSEQKAFDCADVSGSRYGPFGVFNGK